MKRIDIYNGIGAGVYTTAYCLNFIQELVDREKYLIRFINHTDVKKTGWENNAQLFVMPGGATVPFNHALGLVR